MLELGPNERTLNDVLRAQAEEIQALFPETHEAMIKGLAPWMKDVPESCPPGMTQEKYESDIRFNCWVAKRQKSWVEAHGKDLDQKLRLGAVSQALSDVRSSMYRFAPVSDSDGTNDVDARPTKRLPTLDSLLANGPQQQKLRSPVFTPRLSAAASQGWWRSSLKHNHAHIPIACNACHARGRQCTILGSSDECTRCGLFGLVCVKRGTAQPAVVTAPPITVDDLIQDMDTQRKLSLMAIGCANGVVPKEFVKAEYAKYLDTCWEWQQWQSAQAITRK
ncbi:hypothetical protein CYLTODRAFT_459184 [Cylindrobasidium torrendii FP15055 ss-10]|uniref:Zn(2)-C6 fungal-type domain-containing protein n=1 Tax=Cylindrobasidium torrendii FP15055 ss-10 TaxID=1314674 RepID=A0A0D7AWK4_9AGAR|nr:hypothetical protein CYLTODRAFT_459184 [Cylindrobasidium torrendii FP15055 ss-10]